MLNDVSYEQLLLLSRADTLMIPLRLNDLLKLNCDAESITPEESEKKYFMVFPFVPDELKFTVIGSWQERFERYETVNLGVPPTITFILKMVSRHPNVSVVTAVTGKVP